MKRIILSIILLGLIISKSYAQANIGPQLSFGLEIGTPVGPDSKIYKLTEGGSFKLEEPIINGTDLTFTAGYSNFKVYNHYSIFTQNGQYIPIEIGVKHYIPNSLFYIEGDFGVSLNINSYYSSGSQIAFLFAPIFGVSVPAGKNAIDFGVRYEGRIEPGTIVSQLALRMAYKLKLK